MNRTSTKYAGKRNIMEKTRWNPWVMMVAHASGVGFVTALWRLHTAATAERKTEQQNQQNVLYNKLIKIHKTFIIILKGRPSQVINNLV